ncbi:Cysteine-rich CPXCG [Marinobacter persicus]|uniref:Cysteine-rich CPXCG n=1 Tax=Marinobacter persicus TaxID=930118 RepID=A0A1I3U9M1_9GAMM|nr:CPXCG motif-containing cysteine-rich protein [Marinobacter persicus]GHD54308.1 CPXCG motif-containing cysteine-rich protein [Marinobacter persicus]SFJ79605.1 Cysteine-rich CPXCG [Marinobacter persicus]
MPALDSVMIQCPYCWEMLDISIDPSVEEQEYVEDCQVCCNPILITVLITADGTPQVEARAENE